MSETTKKLRAFGCARGGDEAVKWENIHALRDRTADAIDAVEARVAALEAKSPASPAPPRGFRVGDRVRITKAYRCSLDWVGCEGRVVASRDDELGDWVIGDLTKFNHCLTIPMHNEALTLVEPAPEAAPAETDADTIARITAERDALKARVEAAEKERDDARAISDSMAERVLNETRISTELRNELAAANDRLTSQARSIEDVCAELAAANKARAEMFATVAKVTDTNAALRRENETLKQVDALRAKPARKFRTRKVTAADMNTLESEHRKESYDYGSARYARCANALGFRRVVR